MDPNLRRKERTRGHLMQILMQEYPNAMDADVVYFLLNDLGHCMDRETFNFHLGYLLEKRLIRDERRSVGKAINIRLIAATTYGLDVMDGRVKECGIDTEL